MGWSVGYLSIGGDDSDARVTQTFAEVVIKQIPDARVTQTFAEVVIKQIPDARVTQTYVEVVIKP